MPDFGEDFDENEDRDIEELIKGSGNNHNNLKNNKDLYNKIKHMVDDNDA